MTEKPTGRVRNHTGLKQKADPPNPKLTRKEYFKKPEAVIQFSKDNLDS